MTTRLPVKDMDPECVALCRAMNLIPGITTVESCCGHGRDEYCIFFEAKNLAYLPRLLYWFKGCHCGFYGWRVFAWTDCGMSPVSFIAEGPRGEQAYSESLEIARLLRAEARLKRPSGPLHPRTP